jgi:biotin carboxyl carrier protein
MIQATINGKQFTIDNNTVNGEKIQWDLEKISATDFHIIHHGKSLNATIIQVSKEEKKVVVRIGERDYEVAIKDATDLLLEKLGINTAASNKLQHLKSPMPGLIASVAVAPGDTVKKGDTLLILEAMKMENVLKASADAVVKKIHVNIKQAVEKSQLLIEFE